MPSGPNNDPTNYYPIANPAPIAKPFIKFCFKEFGYA